MEEVTRLSTKRNVTVFPGKIKVGPICPTFIRGDPYETQKHEEKSFFQTIFCFNDIFDFGTEPSLHVNDKDKQIVSMVWTGDIRIGFKRRDTLAKRQTK